VIPTPTHPIRKDAWVQILKAAGAAVIAADQELTEARSARDDKIRAAYGTGMFSTREIGRFTDMSGHSVWRIINNWRR
jgi:hypothetical protein